MVVSIPDGYLTRPSAAKVYNRSKRALERDLEDAYTVGDEEVLGAFQLTTNDGIRREAPAVTTELVEKLKKEGMNPVWCVSEVWLEAKYGRKGETKPEQVEKHVEPEPLRIEPEPVESNGIHLPGEVEFLKERIRTLEREKREEIERNEKREAKLFEQLAVKDRQISAWDEVTQGLTRGLATGLITPALSAGPVRQSQSQSDAKRKPVTVVESRDEPEVKLAEMKSKEGTEVKRKRRTTKPKRTSASKLKSTSKMKTKRPASKNSKRPVKKEKKRSWFNTPISELFSRRKK